MSGHYIAFEGIEGAGKSTLALRLVDLLRSHGHRVVQVREPGGTPTGERIRRVLLDPDGSVAPWSEALLFAAARAQLAAEAVGPALRDGNWVVSDRSVYSSLAYQGGGRGLGIDAVRSVNAPGLGDVWPELVVLLRLDAATGLARQEDPDRIGGEGIRFQSDVADAFDRIAAEEPHRFAAVDAGVRLDTVWKTVRQIVEERWEISSGM
jgi:dTMP kinase